MSNTNIHRRSFLGRGSMAAAGLSLGACAVGAEGAVKRSGSPKAKVGINILLWTANPSGRTFWIAGQFKEMGIRWRRISHVRSNRRSLGQAGVNTAPRLILKTPFAAVCRKAPIPPVPIPPNARRLSHSSNKASTARSNLARR